MRMTYLDGGYTKTINTVRVPIPYASSKMNKLRQLKSRSRLCQCRSAGGIKLDRPENCSWCYEMDREQTPTRYLTMAAWDSIPKSPEPVLTLKSRVYWCMWDWVASNNLPVIVYTQVQWDTAWTLRRFTLTCPAQRDTSYKLACSEAEPWLASRIWYIWEAIYYPSVYHLLSSSSHPQDYTFGLPLQVWMHPSEYWPPS